MLGVLYQILGRKQYTDLSWNVYSGAQYKMSDSKHNLLPLQSLSITSVFNNEKKTGLCLIRNCMAYVVRWSDYADSSI